MKGKGLFRCFVHFTMNVNTSNETNIDPNWQKIERDMAKVGLKNGLSDGREINFQGSFDKGYEDGFHNGFILGNLTFLSKQKEKLETLPVLNNAANGMCLVCTDEKENEDVEDVRKKQADFVNSNVERIKLDLETT